MNGWIKLHRELMQWEWYKDQNVKSVFIHLLLMASHEETTWRGMSVNAGDVITSYEKIADQTGLTIKQVRLAIAKLKKTAEIGQTVGAKQGTRFLNITITNYATYQHDGRKQGSKRADAFTKTGQQKGNIQEETNVSKEQKKQERTFPLYI